MYNMVRIFSVLLIYFSVLPIQDSRKELLNKANILTPHPQALGEVGEASYPWD